MGEVRTHEIGSAGAPVHLVCLHGGPGMDYSYFLPFLEPLGEGARLVFYRQNQNGETTMPGLMGELRDVLAGLRGKPVVLLGHSFGSALALEYVREHGETGLAGIVLASWIYDARFRDESVRKNAALYQERKARVKEIEERDRDLGADERFLRKTVEWAPAYFELEFETKGRELLRGVRYDARVFDTLSSNYMASFDLKPVLRDLSLPVLSITGRNDRVIDADYVGAGARLNPRIEHRVLDPGAHFPFVENTKGFNEAVAAFLTGVVR